MPLVRWLLEGSLKMANKFLSLASGGFSPAEAEYQHEYRNPLATDDQRILPYSSGAISERHVTTARAP